MSLGVQLSALLGERVRVLHSVGGGDISQAVAACTERGDRLFVKTGSGLPEGLFRGEAAGLEALGSVSSGCVVPKVIALSDSPQVLVLEWIDRGHRTPRYWDGLGRALAQQHRQTASSYGFEKGDNFIGKTPQSNVQSGDWVTFFRDERLGLMQKLLFDGGAIDDSMSRSLDGLRARLSDWLYLPNERPALLHGDLWSGNTMPGPDGAPVVFDPAVYYGCREADLAMTELFGQFEDPFYRAYEECFPLEEGYKDRRDLYNLYHLLNHLHLFGSSYGRQCAALVKRFV